MVPEKGVEPSRACAQRILSPPRLPFRHSGARLQIYLIEITTARRVDRARLGGLFAARFARGVAQ
jgi:hypothetical protein